MSIFQDLMPSFRLGNWTPARLRRKLLNVETESIERLCEMTMDSDGEYSSLLLAERIFSTYEELNEEQRLDFFTLLHRDYDIDVGDVKTASEAYQSQPNAANLLRLTRAAEPQRRELLRRLNLIPEGARRLVKMREHLLVSIRSQPELAKIDIDFKHLFNAWFNRGFLMMQPIDWTTPAHILEKIIAYEAVHEIKSWAELRNRLEPADRYCYAFFHPSMADEPLVFVEVALTHEIPASIGEILIRDDTRANPEDASCAIFYSISSCHKGLSGISFGNFLIKQVATNLKARFPELKKFSTISPAPGFRRWLQGQADENAEVAELIENFDSTAEKASREVLSKLAAQYFLEAKNNRHEPADPVSRFHLKNGAILERINILGDLSDNGMKQSFGTMVNYVYNLAKVEENHEAYVGNHQVICSSAVKKLLSK